MVGVIAGDNLAEGAACAWSKAAAANAATAFVIPGPDVYGASS